MTYWKQLANYNYMGAFSLEGKAKEIVVTIKSVGQELVTAPGGKQDTCIVVHFMEDNVNGVEVKPMIFNKTNCKATEKSLGTGDIEKWVGKQIVIYQTTTKYQRDLVDCLRVKDTPAPKQLKKAPEAKPQFFCSVCGKEISKNVYDASVAKYGVALCSADCKAKHDEEQAKNNNENEQKGE